MHNLWLFITEGTRRIENLNEVTAITDDISIEEIVTLMNDQPAVIDLPITQVTVLPTHLNPVRPSLYYHNLLLTVNLFFAVACDVTLLYSIMVVWAYCTRKIVSGLA